jgi:hypothetical protein
VIITHVVKKFRVSLEHEDSSRYPQKPTIEPLIQATWKSVSSVSILKIVLSSPSLNCMQISNFL